MPDYKRILLKLSGEVFSTDGEMGIDESVVEVVVDQIVRVAEHYQVAIVTGAGNIWRFRDNQESELDRVASDFKGMEATFENAKAVQVALAKKGVESVINDAFELPSLDRTLRMRKALDEGKVVLCAGGTGNPYFTTDSAASLRALELECDVLLKATNTDGVYDSDPKTNPNAQKYDQISYDEVLEKDLKVMDGAAIALCRDGNLPLQVFAFGEPGNIEKALLGEIGTKVG